MNEAEKRKFDDAFAAEEQRVRVNNCRIGCVLGIIFMPAGTCLDFLVYPENAGHFFLARVISALLLAVVWFVLGTPYGRRYSRGLGLIEVSIPILCISWMIFYIGQPESPYYAGLNLVLMGAGIVLRWGLIESLVLLGITMLSFLAATLPHATAMLEPVRQEFFNNLYFLIVTGVFIVTGNYFFVKLRYREFELRYQLNQSRELLEQNNSRLMELDEAKSQFFANISHELRTPLTLLLAPLQSMRTDSSIQFDSRVSEWLDTMHANGMRLLKLINDLLDLVRSDAGSLRLNSELFNVPEFMNGLISAVRKVAEDKRLQISAEIDDGVEEYFGDRDKLEKVFLNLIFNAIKFTPAGGRIVFGASRVGGGRLEFRVSDTGMGIPADQLKMIFARFWQADMSSQRKYQGVGIGLALVKDLVDLHEGEIVVDSEEGRGTEFRITLPIVGQPEVAVASAGAVSGNSESQSEPDPVVTAPNKEEKDEWLEKLYRRAELFPAIASLQETMRPLASFPSASDRRAKLLIADDEPDMLRFLRSNLSEQFQVLEAVDGGQAIETAQQYQPDVIICDMMMPEVDGLEVCRTLRERETTRHVPILLLTARADEETKITALTAGASDFLSKPFSTTELRVRVSNLCESHLLQRQLAWQNKKLESTLDQLKETETSLVQSEKMASLGRMSAGIIHEINNPLNYAKGALHALKKKRRHLPEAEWEDFDEILTDTEDGVSRVASIISDLRTFSHPNDVEMSEIEIREVFETALRFTSHEWRDKVDVENLISEHLCVTGNRHKLVQVAVNLLQNALDALKGKEFRENERPYIMIRDRPEAGATLIDIRDNGPGMSADTINNIFEPFYTTKRVGDGMGLGLSVCYQIMSELGGRIDVKSEMGKYCEFTLEFPTDLTDSAA